MVRNARASKSKRGFYAALAVVALGGGAVIYSIASKPPAVTRVDPVAPAGEAVGHLRGDPNAPVQILEFADFECPGCAQFATVTEPDVRQRIVDAGLASFRFFDFPLEIHPNSRKAHLTAACAGDQNKFWEMHDRVFAGQNEWNTQTTRNPKGVFEGYARELGLDAAKFEDCYDNDRHAAAIEANRQEGIRRGVRSTPTFFVGDRKIESVIPYDALKAIIDSVRATTPAAAPAVPAAPAPGKAP